MLLMKKFLIILILIFTLQAPSLADDIRDFQIEGMSIGDSALDFYNEVTITSSVKSTPYNDDEFYEVELFNDEDTYKIIGLVFKKFDDKYIIYAIKGMNYLEFGKCEKEKKSVIKDIKTILKNVNEENYKSGFGSKYGNSYAVVTDLDVEGGTIRVWCDNFDKTHEVAKQWKDAMSIDLSTEEFLSWLNNKAYQ